MGHAEEFDQLQRELREKLTPVELEALQRSHPELFDLDERIRLAEETTALLDADPNASARLEAARDEIRRGDVVALDDL